MRNPVASSGDSQPIVGDQPADRATDVSIGQPGTPRSTSQSQIQFRVTASKPGEFDIGPFLISQNGTQKRVDAIKMSFQEVPETEDMQIKLMIPETTLS